RVQPGKWKLGNRIARGSFGVVYMGLNEATGALMAVKVLSLRGSDRDLHELHREMALMRAFSHPNIVSYLGAEIREEHDQLCIFQEWVPGGSVSSLLQRFGPFSEDMTRGYTRQALQGLAYLHSHHVVHRDINGSNILVDDHGVVKLADFGASLQLSDAAGSRADGALKGTPYFMAPEVLQRSAHGMPVDVWSFGGAVLQMVSGEPPWFSYGVSTPYALLQALLERRGQTPPLPADLSAGLRAFLERCFRWDPAERPTAAELALDPFLSED
ncbi:kinase-like domain-containing protein, partial [Tribonema minus]